MTILNANRGAPASAEIRNNSLLPVAGTQQLEELQAILSKFDIAVGDSFARQTVIFHSDAACQFLGTSIDNPESDIEIRVVQTLEGVVHQYQIPAGHNIPMANDGDICYAVLDRTGAPTGFIPSTDLTTANGNLVVGAAALPPLDRSNLFYVPLVQRIDGAFGKKYVHWFFGHGVWVDGAQAQVGLAGTADDPVNTASLLSIRGENRWMASKYEYYTDNVIARYTDQRIDTSNYPYTAILDDAQKNVEFATAGQEFTTINMVDDEFKATGRDIYDAEVLLFFDPAKVDNNIIVEASRDGQHFTQIEMTRLGTTDLMYGDVYFADEPTNNMSLGQAVNNSSFALSVGAKFVAQKIAGATDSMYVKYLRVNLEKQGNPAGLIRASIIKDVGTVSQEIWATSTWIKCSDIVTGNVDFQFLTMVPAGNFYVVLEANEDYYSSYTGTNRLLVGTNNTGSAPLMQSSPDKVLWTNVAATNLFYSLIGRKIDLRVRVRSSQGDVVLAGLCVMYGSRKTLATGFLNRNLFTFTTNTNTFTLDFIPDHRLLECFVRGTGQVFRYGDFEIIGKQVIFPVDFFADAGTSNTIEFVQSMGYSFDESDYNLARMRENGLGSTDQALDLSQAGKGVKLRATNGVLVHAYIQWTGTQYQWVFTPV